MSTYSTTRPLSSGLDSNQHNIRYERNALPIKLPEEIKIYIFGQGGIRTPATYVNGLASHRIWPLCHLPENINDAVEPVGFEPTTFCVQSRRSTKVELRPLRLRGELNPHQTFCRRLQYLYATQPLMPMEGIEPSSMDFQSTALPLSYISYGRDMGLEPISLRPQRNVLTR